MVPKETENQRNRKIDAHQERGRGRSAYVHTQTTQAVETAGHIYQP